MKKGGPPATGKSSAGFDNDDTIVAPATPRGKSALAVVRVSGSMTAELIDKLLDCPVSLKPRRSTPAGFKDLDKVMATYFPAPRSYTGEDMLEISCHGNPYLIDTIITAIEEAGARAARPGEFTMRAYENGKIDLSQAEAVNDLINACSEQQLASARRQLEGALSDEIKKLRGLLIEIAADLETNIDFVEDENPADNAGRKIERLLKDIGELMKSYRAGRYIREGAKLVIAGAPNVGKSTLFNAFLREERAIITEIPGTTRDVISESLEIEGIPVVFLDTAGLRRTGNIAEKEGVNRSLRALKEADLVIVLLDASRKLSAEDERLLKESSGLNRLLAVNKADLNPEYDLDKLPACEKVLISAKEQNNLDVLTDMISANLPGAEPAAESVVVTNARHYRALADARKWVSSALESMENGVSEEYTVEDLRAAVDFLDSITGGITPDDILNNIFSRFCIGK